MVYILSTPVAYSFSKVQHLTSLAHIVNMLKATSEVVEDENKTTQSFEMMQFVVCVHPLLFMLWHIIHL